MTGEGWGLERGGRVQGEEEVGCVEVVGGCVGVGRVVGFSGGVG